MPKEIKIKGSVDFISMSSTKTIFEQMKNTIFKIKLKGASGTGFFCKITYENNLSINCLMTNYHVIDEKYYKENKEIKLLLNDDKEPKIIDLNKERRNYFNENYDITIIEIIETDKVKNFLELDENIFKDEIEISYEDQSIYTIQYPNGKNAMVSYGLVNQIQNYDIKHTCCTDHGSSGSPILKIDNNKLIGIHKEGSNHFNFNKGTFLKFPLNDFILKLKIKSSNKNKYPIEEKSKNINNEAFESSFAKEVKICSNMFISLLKLEEEINDKILEIIENVKIKEKDNYPYNPHFKRYYYLSEEFENMINKIYIIIAYSQYYTFDEKSYETEIKMIYKYVSKLFKFSEEIPEYFSLHKKKLISKMEYIKSFIEEEIIIMEKFYIKASNDKKTINIHFFSESDGKFHIKAFYGISVEHIIKKYLFRLNLQLYMIDNPNYRIIFLFNTCYLNINDKTPIETFFKEYKDSCVNIIVIE